MPRNPLPLPPSRKGVRPEDDAGYQDVSLNRLDSSIANWKDWMKMLNSFNSNYVLNPAGRKLLSKPNWGVSVNFDDNGNVITSGDRNYKFVNADTYPSRGGGTRKRLYKADEKDDGSSWTSRFSDAAVDFIVRNKAAIEQKAKGLSDQGFDYLNRNKANIGRGAKNLSENAIDYVVANKKNIERGAKFVSDKAFDYVRRNKPDIEGVDYVLNNKKEIERGAKNLSDQGFDYLRRNKSGIGRSVENATNQALDYVSSNKKNIEREAQNYANQAFDYLRNNKKEIGRQAQNAVNRMTGRTTKRATPARAKSASHTNQGGFVNGKPVNIKKFASKNKYF